MYALASRALRLLDPETAHRLTIRALKAGLGPVAIGGAPPALRTRVFSLGFPNPIGLAAGFDKNAEVPRAMLRAGFGFVETGTVTPRPQSGNPKPRIFRLAEDRAVINRLGFNNEGMEAAAARLERLQGAPGVIGVNIGANKESDARIADYVAAFTRLAPLGRYVTVNISSPNTPGLRGLQDRAALEELLARLMDARAKLNLAKPVLLKIAPDLDAKGLEDVAEVALGRGLDGLIVSNTTIARPEALRSRHRDESGGLSGAPLFAPSTEVLRAMARLTQGRLPIVGAGGIGSGADAYAKIRAGASLVQLYTALAYEGPGLVARIKRELAGLLARDGFKNVAEAVGADAR